MSQTFNSLFLQCVFCAKCCLELWPLICGSWPSGTAEWRETHKRQVASLSALALLISAVVVLLPCSSSFWQQFLVCTERFSATQLCLFLLSGAKITSIELFIMGAAIVSLFHCHLLLSPCS